MREHTTRRWLGSALSCCGLALLLIGCQAQTDPPPIATAAEPSAMPVPRPSPRLGVEVDALIKAYTVDARRRYEQGTLTEKQDHDRQQIIRIWTGQNRYTPKVPPRFDFDPVTLWAVCFDIGSDPAASEPARLKCQKLRLKLIAERAIAEEHYAMARVLFARMLLMNSDEDPASEHAYQTPHAFMLMGDHGGLCRWYRWHLLKRESAQAESLHDGKPRALVRIRDEMAEQWARLARMEGDRGALIGWARVLYTPKPPYIEGYHPDHSPYDPDSYTNRWRQAWQAWALGLPEAEQRQARRRFLEGVERGWRERVLLEINRETDGPTELADASEAEFERCLKRFKEARWPRWRIRSFKPGPFDADRARGSQQRLKQAWARWSDTLDDDNAAADVRAYVMTQHALLQHLEDLNRIDGYYMNIKNNLEAAYRFLVFDFNELLEHERIRRKYAIYTQDGAWNLQDKRDYEFEQLVESARLGGDPGILVELERPYYYKDAPAFGAEHYEYTLREAAKNYDTHYFTWCMDRYLSRHREAPRHFWPHGFGCADETPSMR